MNTKEHESFSKYISKIYRYGNSFLTKEFSSIGIGAGQYLFLIHLYKNDGISQEDLSDLICIDKGTTAKAIKKLEELNFVIRIKDTNDKRINRIFLTSKALEVRNEFFNILNRHEAILTKNLTEEEINLGLKILEKMNDI